jgi:nicotinamidase-related amidase
MARRNPGRRRDGAARVSALAIRLEAVPRSIPAEPYDFPLSGALALDETALVVVDMQGDFCSPGGMMDRQGLDHRGLASPTSKIARLLVRARDLDLFVCHTRETYLPDLSDAQPNRLWRGRDGNGVCVGDTGPLGRHLIKGEPGWDIIPELAPLPGEPVFDKSSYGAFATTAIGAVLAEKGIRNLIVAGVTSDCCVHQTVQEALDRGYDCLTVSDASAATFAATHEAAMRLIRVKGGVFGATATTDIVLAALA